MLLYDDFIRKEELLFSLYGMETYITCFRRGANPAEVAEYHILSGFFLAAGVTAQQGEILAVHRCPYFHLGGEEYLRGTDLHEIGHYPMDGSDLSQVDGGIQVVGAKSLPAPVHIAFTATQPVKQSGIATALIHFFVLVISAIRRISYLLAYTFVVVGTQLKAFAEWLISVEKACRQQYGIFYDKWLLIQLGRCGRFGAVRCIADVNRIFFRGEGEHDSFLGIVDGLVGLHLLR